MPARKRQRSESAPVTPLQIQIYRGLLLDRCCRSPLHGFLRHARSGETGGRAKASGREPRSRRSPGRADFLSGNGKEPNRRAAGHQDGMPRHDLRRAVLKSTFRNLLLRVDQDEMIVSSYVGRRNPCHVAVFPNILKPMFDGVPPPTQSAASPIRFFAHASGTPSIGAYARAGEAEADEPLAVELPRRLLQEPSAAGRSRSGRRRPRGCWRSVVFYRGIRRVGMNVVAIQSWIGISDVEPFRSIV